VSTAPGAPGPTGHDVAEAVNAARLATLGMLLAGVAHELNTPLGALGSNHDVLKRALRRLQDILADEVVEPSELDEVRRIVRALDGIMRVNDLAVERVTALVESLRGFGRPDRAEVDVVDVHEGIDAALTLLRHRMKDRIEVVREYGAPPRVECLPQQLNQVFMNLLLNASQAIPGRGTITIRTAAEGDGVRIDIEDTGTGMPESLLERIFEPGFTTKGNRVGMGLGLLITRQVVDRHGGRLSVRSVPGAGATFTVWLPSRLPARPGAAPGAAGAVP
jgi:two-component system NtrC family sensor kinase